MAARSRDRWADTIELVAALVGVVLVLAWSVWDFFGSAPGAPFLIGAAVAIFVLFFQWWRSSGAPAVAIVLGVGLLAGGGLIIYALIAFEPATAPLVPTTTAPATTGPPTSGTASTAPTTAPPPPTTSPPVYTIDIDHDGKIDFVASGSQLVAVPKDRSDNAPVIVALIGGIFLVASTLGAAFVTVLGTRSKKDSPAVVVQYPPPQSAGGPDE